MITDEVKYIVIFSFFSFNKNENEKKDNQYFEENIVKHGSTQVDHCYYLSY